MNEEIKKLLKKVLIQVIFPILVGVGSGYGTFLFNKSKYDTQVVENKLKNVQTAISIWKNMALDLQEQIDVQKTKIETLEFQIIKLKKNCR